MRRLVTTMLTPQKTMAAVLLTEFAVGVNGASGVHGLTIVVKPFAPAPGNV